MSTSNPILYYLSASIAIVGTVGYHHLLKKIPGSVDPLVSIMAIYIGILAVGLVAAPFIYTPDKMIGAVKQLGWIQVGVSVCIILMEFGFLLMYRSGWDLSVGNIVTGVAINLVLMTIGVTILKESLSTLNIIGVLFCIAGVAMIGFRGPENADLLEPSHKSVNAGVPSVTSTDRAK